MTCIVVNAEPLARKAIKTLINQTDSLVLIASFNNTANASKFISENKIDLVFLDIHTDETNSYEFVKAIPRKTFLIYIPDLSPTISRKNKYNVIDNLKLERFQIGIDMAKDYSIALKKGNLNITGDYFVI